MRKEGITMKRLIGFALALCLLLSCSSALAVFDFTGTLGNEATFETLEEARANAPAIIAQTPGSVAMGNAAAPHAAHPALDNFPAGTAFVYRSPDMYGGFAAARMNSTFLVYAEQVFESKDAAFEYIKTLGLIELVDSLRGSIVLVTPANGKAFAAADQTNFYNLETAVCGLKAKITQDGVRVTMADSDYYGTFKNLYVIGIEGGATFLNDYVVGVENFVSRIAGMLLFNGKMAPLSKIASLIPAYLVNADEATIGKYKAANQVDSFKAEDGKAIYFDQQFPVRKVIVAKDLPLQDAVKDAFERIFKRTMRIQVMKNGLISGGTTWANLTGDCAPYSLNRRVVIGRDGMTELGAKIIKTVDFDMFKDIQTHDGEYLTTWYEILPATLVEGEAKEGTIPLVLCLAGTGDDPLQVAEELGWIAICEEKGIAVVSPGHEGIFEDSQGDGVEYETMPKLIQYMLDKYPELDRTRVYVSGYSRGGRTTMKVAMGCPEMLAAIVPCAANQFIVSEERDAHLYETKMPCMLLTSTADVGTLFNATLNRTADAMITCMNYFARYNQIPEIPAGDEVTYPISGFKADSEIHMLLNDEFWNHRFFLNDAEGVPMLGISITEGLQHALYPPYAQLAWDYMEHFSRNPETYEITYTADPTDF